VTAGPGRSGERYGSSVTNGFEVLWQRTLHERPQVVRARAADGVLVTLERGTRLVRLDPLTGELRWEVKVEDPWGDLALGEDVCVYVSGHGSMRCVELDSGRVRWVRPNERFRRHLCVAQGAVTSGGWRGYRPLRGYDVRSGDELWSRTVLGEESSENQVVEEFHRPEPFVGGVLICPRNGRDLWMIDVRTGVVVQRWDLPEPITADVDARAFWPTGDGQVTFSCGASVAVLDPVGGIATVWADPDDRPTGAQLLFGGRLWIGHRDRVGLIDTRSGIEQDLLMEEGPVGTAAIPVGDDVFVLTRAGLLRKYDARGRAIGQIRLSRRGYALASAATGLVHAMTKGSVVGIRVG